ncbi:family 16 glycosylhydrolase [uncultured Winogradskyella sp.]|uniref:family 16 glycosylhydrolase n=1 Tax=uncultured Winogradskyella sp. TaxID=395353 RepID=UPI002623223B|nr:family 16 glycosylhydrolase [uncultured Winogradskyella sp.]
MKRFYGLITLLYLCYGVLYAQHLPIGFSEVNENFIGFGGSGFSFNTNPNDSNDAVGQFFNDGNDIWQGFFLDLAVPIDLSVEQQLSLDFYQFDPQNHTIILKLENGTAENVEVILSNSGTGWTEGIVFDFSNATISGTSTNIYATGSYSRLTLFIDGGTNQTGTYLIDDINNGTVPINPNELDVIYTDLVWADEFDTNGAVDVNNWFLQTQLPAGGNWFNGEEQHYTNRIENAFVENGFLNIVAKKEVFTDQGETKQYTSARLNSKFAFTHGRVDVRAKLPEGDGTWPAIWTLGKNINEDGAYWDNQGFGTTSWPACGEIDIMEHGLYATNQVSVALHSPSSFGNTVNTATQMLADVANDFHVYSVNWSPNQITFLIDGVGYYTYNPAEKDENTWPFNTDQYLLLNIAMGGVSGVIDPNFNQSSMVIDYVRVYQNSSLSTGDNLKKNSFNVYPNPAKTSITLAATITIDRITISNTLGQTICSRYNNLNQIDVSNLNAGLYILKIYAGDIIDQKRIIIE